MSSHGGETRRLFFALWPSAELQQACYRRARRVVREGGGRPVVAANLHLTLAFPGSVGAEVGVCLEEIASAISLSHFTLTLDHAGYWPGPRVSWLGSSETPSALRELARRLNDGMTQCGLKPEQRPFTAHVTVARKALRGPLHPAIEPLAWAVADFVLAQSLTLPEGAQYKVLRRWPLVPDGGDRD